MVAIGALHFSSAGMHFRREGNFHPQLLIRFVTFREQALFISCALSSQHKKFPQQMRRATFP